MQRSKAIELKWDLFAAIMALILGATVALLVGAHAEHFKDVLILSSVMGLAGGFYCIYSAAKLLGRLSEAAAAASAERARRRDADDRGGALVRAAAADTPQVDTSPMEVRLTGSLKSIRDAAEQGLFASDAEKGHHLRAIWSMAACDLDDDPGKLAH